MQHAAPARRLFLDAYLEEMEGEVMQGRLRVRERDGEYEVYDPSDGEWIARYPSEEAAKASLSYWVGLFGWDRSAE